MDARTDAPDPLSEPAGATPRRSPRPAFFGLATFALLVAIFARGRAILVPLALSIMVAFALGPAVRRLERHLGRALAVALVVLVALGAVSGFGYLLKRQVDDLFEHDHLFRFDAAKDGRPARDQAGGLTGLSKSLDKVVREMDSEGTDSRVAKPVRVVPAATTALDRIASTLEPVLEPMTMFVVVLVLVVFLLSKREDLRDRFVRLAGRGNVTLTTRALDEAGQRISRFITHQSAINVAFGVVIAGGLAAIGLPYAPLWGFVAAVLGFVPFVGSLLAMLFPALLAFAQFEGWWQLLATLGLFLGLDMLTAYVIEPVIIGAKTGVSSMAMLISAIFWAWLWGPVGLVLATPLTVCLAVLGKNVPRLGHLSVLLGDEAPLEPDLIFYQRLLAGDEEEAQEILEKSFQASPRGQVFDEVVVPTLILSARDRARHEISEVDQASVVRTIQALMDAFPAAIVVADPAISTPRMPLRRVLAVSARSVADELIWEMLRELLDPTKVAIESVGAAYLASDTAAATGEGLPELVCVTAIPPGGLARAAYICRRLRLKLPEIPILVLRLRGLADDKQAIDRLIEAGATGVVFTLDGARASVEQRLLASAPSVPA